MSGDAEPVYGLVTLAQPNQHWHGSAIRTSVFPLPAGALA